MKSIQSLAARAIFLLIVSTTDAQVTNAQSPVASLHYEAGNIQFIGVEDDMLVFELVLSNLPKEGSWLRITDENATLIFEERIKSNRYNKRYKIMRNNMNKIQFEITNKRTLLKESFQINRKIEEKREVSKAR